MIIEALMKINVREKPKGQSRMEVVLYLSLYTDI